MRSQRAIRIAVLVAAVLAVAAFLGGCSRTAKVPDVRGKTLADAQRILEQAGYTQGPITRAYTPGATPGTVFQQFPLPGAKLKKGEAVAIRIALPLGAFVVPSVTGKPAEEASSSISAASLTPKAVDEYSDTVAKGIVIAQVPDAGAKVQAGATVVYVVSKGKAPASVKVPNVVGKSKSDAESAIEKAGLVPDAEQVYSDTIAKDKVVMQSPAAGASAAPGSTVGYTVSLGKPPAPTSSVGVPNVTGKAEADAVNAIKGAGLAASVNRQASSSVAKGIVISQMPPAGTKTAPGGTVGIVVSTGPEAQATVPNVVGTSEADAKAGIEAAGLVMDAVDQPSSDVATGDVIAQYPAAGTKVAPGSSVVVAVSVGVPSSQ